MKRSTRTVALLLVVCLAGETFAISLPSILSGLSLTGKLDSEEEVEKEPADTEDRTVNDDDEKRPPLVPAIPHPADTNLNPLNNPNHPLHPHNLPHLPHLPHFTRETIHATKTVFVEVTDRVTIHPVCMTAYKSTPPCLPYNPHHGSHGTGGHHHHHPFHHRDGEVADDLQEEGSAKASLIQPSKSAVLPEATRAEHHPKYLQLVESNRYVGGEFISQPDDAVVQGAEESTSDDSERGARYMEITPYINPAEEVQIKDEPAAYSALTPLHMVHDLLHRHPVTHYKTKTLWVTKVEKVLDTRVTATLLAKNCVPINSHIPICSPHHGVFGPGYHGQYGQNGHHTYTENLHGHGHGHSGSFTEKAEEYSPEGEVVEQRAADAYYDLQEEEQTPIDY